MIKNSEGNAVWHQRVPNAATSQRPLMIQKGKESKESLQSVSIFNYDIDVLKNEGIAVPCSDGFLDMKAVIVNYCWTGKQLIYILDLVALTVTYVIFLRKNVQRQKLWKRDLK